MKNKIQQITILIVMMAALSICACFAMNSFAASAMSIDEIQVLDLETAQRIALAKNPSIEAAAQRVKQAKERIDQAKSAYWPMLDASASASRVEISDHEEQRSTGGYASILGIDLDTNNPEEYYGAGLSASWTVFDGFERKFATAAARFGHRESRAAERETQRLLLSAVSQAYHNALLARENIRIAEADETFNRKQLEDAKARRRVGTGSLSDELNFEVQINTAKSNLIESRRSYQVALYALASLMGLPDAKFPAQLQLSGLQEETAVELEAPSAEPLIETAVNYRPDLIRAEFAVQRSEKEIGIAKSDYYPVVRLVGNLDGERPNSARLAADDFGNSIALSLSYNIFSGGLHRARVNEAKFSKKEAENNFEDAMIAVKGEVRETLESLCSAQEQLVLQRSNAQLVRQNRELVEKEYAAGQTSLVRLNEAQRDLTGAEARLALARVSLRQAWQDLKAATGEILASFGCLDMTRTGEQTPETTEMKGADS